MFCEEWYQLTLGSFGRGKDQGVRVVCVPEACIVFVSWNPRQGYDPIAIYHVGQECFLERIEHR